MPVRRAPASGRFRIAEIDLSISCDDPLFLSEFASLFGSPHPALRATLSPLRGARELESVAHGISVVIRDEDDEFASLIIEGDDLPDPAAFFLTFTSPDVPLKLHPGSRPERPMIALGDDARPLFVFEGAQCRFRKVPRWRRIVSHAIFLRLLRLRDDLIFLHASMVEVTGHGLLLVGPKGTGKTTVALALGSRGHSVLGDETAIYEPSTGRLIPFRRPAAIKPGPAAARVHDIVARSERRSDEDGVLRIPLEEFAAAEVEPVLLQSMIFLRSFADRPSLCRVERPGAEEISLLQPLASSLAGPSSTRHVFEMIKLCATVPIFHLWPADPDETAGLIEEVLASHAADRC
jgi:hypothetical protein